MMPGDDGGKRIVIAEVATLELIDRNGIVFVDDRNDVHIEQLTECIFHVAAADGLRGDICREQDLRDVLMIFAEEFIVGKHQLALADGGKRLLFGGVVRALRQSELAHAHANGAGRNEHDATAAVL